MGALSGYGELFSAQIGASGVVPQIALIMGPVAGGQAYSMSLMDFVFMVEKSQMFLAGPPLVKALVFQEATAEQLGGPKLHAEVTGVSDFTAKDDADCIARVKELLSYLPGNCDEEPPYVEPKDKAERVDEELLKIIPTDSKKPYDMHEVVRRIVDEGKFLEIKRDYARNLITCLARMDGHVVGIVASNPAWMAGCLDVKSSEKGSRFVNFCDAFNIPLVTLQDVPGYLVGIRSERDGIIRQGGKMLRAYAQAGVPKVTVVVRKSYAGGYLGLCSKELGADFVFELPTAEICLMGAEGAVNVIFRKEISAAKDPEEARKKYIREFSEKYVNPLYSAGLQHVDDIIDPRRMRPVIIKALEIAKNKAEG
jgi:acetyl-CoA carboxylase carboxyltransferase component